MMGPDGPPPTADPLPECSRPQRGPARGCPYATYHDHDALLQWRGESARALGSRKRCYPVTFEQL